MPRLTGQSLPSLTYIEIDASKLRAIREAKGLRQKWVAEQLGLSKATYSMIERGEVKPAYTTVEGVCELFGITITDIADVSSIAKTLDALKRVGKLYGLDIQAA